MLGELQLIEIAQVYIDMIKQISAKKPINDIFKAEMLEEFLRDKIEYTDILYEKLTNH